MRACWDTTAAFFACFQQSMRKEGSLRYESMNKDEKTDDVFRNHTFKISIADCSL